MTTMQQPAESAAPDVIQKEAVGSAWLDFLKALGLVLLALTLLFAVMYAYGWYRAYRLSHKFLADADAYYREGEYLNALTGREVYNEDEEQYEQIGGYIDVERIWSHRYSWPAPDIIQTARERSNEIINERLTAAEAEQYIQANIGREAPYFAEIYFRLGELYLQEGDEMGAREIYESMPQLFPRRQDLIQAAEEQLAQLESSE